MRNPTFYLLEAILALRHGYMTGKTRKLHFDLNLPHFQGADTDAICEYFSRDALMIVELTDNYIIASLNPDLKR